MAPKRWLLHLHACCCPGSGLEDVCRQLFQYGLLELLQSCIKRLSQTLHVWKCCLHLLQCRYTRFHTWMIWACYFFTFAHVRGLRSGWFIFVKRESVCTRTNTRVFACPFLPICGRPGPGSFYKAASIKTKSLPCLDS